MQSEEQKTATITSWIIDFFLLIENEMKRIELNLNEGH